MLPQEQNFFSKNLQMFKSHSCNDTEETKSGMANLLITVCQIKMFDLILFASRVRNFADLFFFYSSCGNSETICYLLTVLLYDYLYVNAKNKFIDNLIVYELRKWKLQITISYDIFQ